ncbi:MAG: hypothetical protein M1838_005427 [Thelocarpon superellum]|nr:MAG: hypothetical protein M1838_005427 [Thelocarpon superellum]
MHFLRIGPLALAVGLADRAASASLPQIATSSAVRSVLESRISKCQSDAYIIVSQPRVRAADFQSTKASPRLRQGLNGKRDVWSSIQVADVVGILELDTVEQLVTDICEATRLEVDASTGFFDTIDDMKPRVMRVEFSDLPESELERTLQLSQNDAFLSSLIDLLPSSRYSVFYTTTPISNTEAASKPTADSTDAAQRPSSVELKRDLNAQASQGNTTLIDGPLFQRYQFFTPAIFMGLVVSFLLLTILYLGISGVASLKVSYAAFDKEMGPAAQKKQQ